MSDWIEQDGKEYFEEGYFELCRTTALSQMLNWCIEAVEAYPEVACDERMALAIEKRLSDAGRERAVRELRACADSLWATAETFIDATHPGWRAALKAASERCHSRAGEIAKEGV